MGGSWRKLWKRHVSFWSGLGLGHGTSERVLNINSNLERHVAGERGCNEDAAKEPMTVVEQMRLYLQTLLQTPFFVQAPRPNGGVPQTFTTLGPNHFAP